MGIFTHFAQTDSGDYSSAAPLAAGVTADNGPLFFALLMTAIVLATVTYVVGAYLLSRIFKKAGLPIWKAWVPVYNTWLLFEMGGHAGWWAIVLMIPGFNLAAAVVLCLAFYRIGLMFGKSGAFVLLAIFFPLIWLAWLAYDTSTWHRDAQLDPDNQTPRPPQE